ncbi:unannotated protein [freshwater metagenome]|uniref:Unannotated protein n=1 Tax=freshwater metagenome TaxID=449393 RepID=A0A6J6VP66_9ZZZZ|nr:hypothetical protein [Actinomycetota bacterium]
MAGKDGGELVYTTRGFLQDAQDAMGVDIMRGLIELITNADDAYNGAGGPIIIQIREATDPFKWLLSIHDKAGGLDADGLKKAFSNLGDENQKFAADKGTRGLFGRGAKDVAVFGRARFHSVNKGKYSELQILPKTAKWERNAINIEPTPEILRELRLADGETGLTAEIYVTEQYKIPNTNQLIERLQTHVQLRDLINRNQVVLIDARSKTEMKLIGLEPSGNRILDIEFPVPGYRMNAKLEVYKFNEKQPGNVDIYSKQGLVISGRGAAYENSFLTLDGRPEAGWFSGRLDVPEIHDLARASDNTDVPDPKNPTRIVSRQRNGLVRGHPFYRALAGAINAHLKPLFDEAANDEGANKKEGKELRKRLDLLEQALGKALQDILDETDLGDLPTENDPDDDSQELQFIPPRKVVAIGESSSLTIRAPKSLDTSSLTFKVTQTSKVISLRDSLAENLVWRDHPRLNVKQTAIQVIGEDVGVATVSVVIGDVNASCELIGTKLVPAEEVIPDQIAFEYDEASIAPTKRRRLLLKAPLEFVGDIVLITSDSELFSVNPRVKLSPSQSGTHANAVIIAHAGSELGVGSITAQLVGKSSSCALKIVEPGQNRYPKIHTSVVGNENPPRRVDMRLEEDGRLFVKIFGRHPSLQRVFGKHLGQDEGFVNDQSPEAHATIGEIVAQQLSIYAVEREAGKHPERFTDPSSAFARQQEFIPRFIQLLQLILLENE